MVWIALGFDAFLSVILLFLISRFEATPRNFMSVVTYEHGKWGRIITVLALVGVVNLFFGYALGNQAFVLSGQVTIIGVGLVFILVIWRASTRRGGKI